MTVLGAATGLGRQDALHLDLRPAPHQPHLVGQRCQRGHRLGRERRQRGQLVGLELPALVDQRVGCGGHQGAGVHGRGPYRPA